MSKISSQEHQILQQRLFLEPDGELSRRDAAELERHLAGCSACRRERREVAALGESLAAAAVVPDPDLARRVMDNLPPAGWETRSPRSWRLAAAILAVVAAGAAWVAGGGETSLAAGPVLAAVRAVSDLLLTTAVAGAGLLGASWQGLGLALGEVFGGSRLTLVVFAVFVAGVDFLLVRYLLRQPRQAIARRRRR